MSACWRGCILKILTMIKKARDAYLNALIQETEALLLSAKKHKDYVGQRQLEQQLAKQKAQREQIDDWTPGEVQAND